jgi:hypothetical protein
MEQELVGLIPSPLAVLCRLELTPDVPLAFHGYLHNGRGHCAGSLSWQGEPGAEGSTDPTHPERANTAHTEFVICD